MERAKERNDTAEKDEIGDGERRKGGSYSDRRRVSEGGMESERGREWKQQHLFS